MKLPSPSPKSGFWFCALILGPALLIGQYSSAANIERKVVQRVSPQYPAIARQFNAAGTVRLQVEIAPNGDVKNVKALGGHPLLIPAATEAVRHWKYEPAKENSTAIVEFQFVANQ